MKQRRQQYHIPWSPVVCLFTEKEKRSSNLAMTAGALRKRFVAETLASL
jgi:hypothetical protein